MYVYVVGKMTSCSKLGGLVCYHYETMQLGRDRL